MSVLLRPSAEVASWHLVTLAMAVAATQVLRGRTIEAFIKWPNDIMAIGPDGKERKLAGILAQAIHGDQPGIVVGIGLNRVKPLGLPDEISARGVWLDELVTTVPTGPELAQAILESFAAELQSFPDETVSHARQHCVTIGREVCVHTLSGDIVGRATDLDDDGALRVSTGSGVESFHSGDVVHLR